MTTEFPPRDLTLRNLSEEEFQGAFESCGDTDPYGLCLNGQVIGLVLVRYDEAAFKTLQSLGIELVKS